MKAISFVTTTILAIFLNFGAHAQKNYEAGVSDIEIKVGQTVPLSGPASAYMTIAKAETAYINYINDRGGVNGRKIRLIQYDDAYSPPKAVEQVRRLVESDEVLLTFQIIGTPSNAAVQKYLNAKKVPHLFGATGATRFSDHKAFPWTMGFNPNYQSEGRVYGQYILEHHPDAKIGVLYQNDDLGRDYVVGLKQALGDRAKAMIVGELSYDLADPTIDSQIVRLKDLGANVLFDAATAKFTAQAIKKVAEIGWNVTHVINANSTSVNAVLKPAGLNNSKGVVSISVYKDAEDPQWKSDEGMRRYIDVMSKYNVGGDNTSFLSSYGYSAAELLVQVLRQCGDNLTRENVMRQASSLKAFIGDLYLPGISVSTSPTDYRVNKQFQLMKFDGERWRTFGAVVTDDLTTK